MADLSIHLVPYYHAYPAEELRPYCLNYLNSSGELASTRFTYDSKGRNDRAFYQQITGGRSSTNQHKFDKENRMIRKDRQYNDGETSTELFEYDASGRLVRETFESSKGAKGTASYVYDDQGNAVKMTCEGYKGWLRGVIEFEFDDSGRRTAATVFDGDGKAGSIKYQYDPEGCLVQEHWQIGDWSQTLRYAYESATA